jgi:hypothetical protein
MKTEKPILPRMSDAKACAAGVANFAAAMLEKLTRKRRAGRGGWHRPQECSNRQLADMLLDHVQKGDPVDIGNFAMMIYNRDRVIGLNVRRVDQAREALRAAWIDRMHRYTAAGNPRRDPNLRELQTSLPWTVHYHRDFRAAPMTHKDFAHALVHVVKAAGRIAAVVNDAEHGGSEFKAEEIDRFVADLVVCALRMANTCPGRTIDLQEAVERRIRTKNSEAQDGVKQ